VQACEEIAVLHEHSSVALVSHGDVIATVLAHYLGMPTDLYRRLRVAPASISRIELPVEGPPAVSLVNHVPEAS
jgi:broad specificity phosphatase PhoE